MNVVRVVAEFIWGYSTSLCMATRSSDHANVSRKRATIFDRSSFAPGCARKLIRLPFMAIALLVTGCATTENKMNTELESHQRYASGDKAVAGYRHDEATQFIEFCVELDNQDDRLTHPNDQVLRAQIDPTLWVPVFDSRDAVAHDTVTYFNHLSDPDALHWGKLFDEIIKNTKHKHPTGWNAIDIAQDPDLNGFGPWQNAWILYEGQGSFAGSYAIAIRGTVFSNKPSVAEDAWFHAVVAKEFLSKSVSFADFDGAALHSGFTHATFTLLLDKRYGILAELERRNLAANSRLYIVGHSQGAAMATLTHAFLHYAMRHDNESAPVLGLNNKNFKLKSYAIAQPKPGNYAFAADFASITQQTDNAIVINNHIDPVPKVPLTLEGSGDLEDDFRGSSFAVRSLHFVAGFGKSVRGGIAWMAEPFVKDSAKGYSYFYHYDQLKPIGEDQTAASWHFVPAGRVLLVFGHPGDPEDLFFQHHATTYRELIRAQLR